ncbi:MAG: AraC family transcriptional regulator [Eubacteriales bacterium]|nr:AraC family transcriptional regulator [Eubacteriales bacterium]
MADNQNDNKWFEWSWPADQNRLIDIRVFHDNQSVTSHAHDFVEIVLVAKGSCTHRYHNTEIRLIPGDLFVVLPHETHAYEINEDVIIYNCIFYDQALKDDWDNLRQIGGIFDMLVVEPLYRIESSTQEIMHLKPTELTFVENIMIKMLEEQKECLAGYVCAQKAYLILLITFMGRIWVKQVNLDTQEHIGKRDLLVEAIRHLDANFESDLQIADLAMKVFMSPQRFRKVFKDVTGMNPLDYINAIRINQAIDLLNDNSLSISEVSQRIGILDTNYFSRLFKIRIGSTPSEYRKKHQIT